MVALLHGSIASYAEKNLSGLDVVQGCGHRDDAHDDDDDDDDDDDADDDDADDPDVMVL